MKVCFVGIGSIAKRHIRNLNEVCKKRGIELHIDALRRETSDSGEVQGTIENIYTTVKQLPSDYDVVFLTNPTEYHAEMLDTLHNKGHHFFIEKPVASLGTVDKLKNISFRKDSVYYVACPLRYTNVIRFLKENINPKTVNAVRCISSSYLPDWRPGTDYRKSYSANKSLGGGVDIDLIHEWDYLTYLFGMPSSVKSFSGKVSKLDIDSNDYAVYIAQYGDEMALELHLDYFGRKTIRTIEIFTDEDTVRGDLISGTIEYLKAGKTINLSADRDEYQKRELESFLNTIDSGNKSQNDIANAIKVLKLTQGIIE